VSVSVAVAVCSGEPESLALKVNDTGSAVTASGVPLIVPEGPSRVNPDGSVPEIRVHE
jgi:hypothetical protein